jgi:hypothetical protein
LGKEIADNLARRIGVNKWGSMTKQRGSHHIGREQQNVYAHEQH